MADEHAVPLDDDMVGPQKPVIMPVTATGNVTIQPNKGAKLTADEREFIEEFHTAINDNEHFDKLATQNDLLFEIAQKKPELLMQILKDAEVRNSNVNLDDEIYERIERYVKAALKEVGYVDEQAVKSVAVETNPEDTKLTDSEKSFMIRLHNAIENEQFFQGLPVENDTLANITKKNPDIIFGALKDIEEKQDIKYDADLGKNERYLKAALKAIDYLAEESKISESPKKPSRLKSFLAGFLAASVSVIGGLAYLAADPEAKSNVSKYTSKAGYPLTPEDQVKIILEKPELLERLTKRLEDREGGEEIMSALQSGDRIEKARALAHLKVAIDEALNAAEATQDNVTKKARSVLGR